MRAGYFSSVSGIIEELDFNVLKFTTQSAQWISQTSEPFSSISLTRTRFWNLSELTNLNSLEIFSNKSYLFISLFIYSCNLLQYVNLTYTINWSKINFLENLCKSYWTLTSGERHSTTFINIKCQVKCSAPPNNLSRSFWSRKQSSSEFILINRFIHQRSLLNVQVPIVKMSSFYNISCALIESVTFFYTYK